MQYILNNKNNIYNKRNIQNNEQKTVNR
jgi:hypothetical protein